MYQTRIRLVNMPIFKATGPIMLPQLLFELFSKPDKKKTEEAKEAPKNTPPAKQEPASYIPGEDYDIVSDSYNLPEGYHSIVKGETLYKIANTYGISVSELIKANPQLKTDRNGNKIIQEGALLKLPESAEIQQKPAAGQEQNRVWGSWTIEKSKGAFSVMSKFNLYKEELQKLNPDIDLDNIKADTKFQVPGYEVQAGDSFASIAKEHDITAKMLKELNPNVKALKAGTVINVPKKADDDLGLGEIAIEVEEYVSEAPKSYTVKNGDTLSEIAEDLGVPVWAIMLTNDIKDARKLAANRVLEIPTEDEIKELEKNRTSAAEHGNKKIKVAKDDMLSSIAAKTGIPSWAIAAKNNIKDPDKLEIGQILEIPSKEEVLMLKRADARNKITPKVQVKNVRRKSVEKKLNPADFGAISPNMGLVVHRVKPKDSVTSIAKEYGVSVKDLVAYNNLSGKSLTLPLAKQKITTLKIVGNQKAVMEVTGVSQDFLNDLISLEKKRRTLYDDGCGFLTIGVGHNTKAHRDASKYRGRTLKDTEIYSLLARDILEAQNIAKKHLKGDFDKLSQKQKEAIYSLIFNTGGLNSSPKLVKAIKDGKFGIAAQQFDHVLGTVNGRKEVMPGLAKRRFVEIATFVEGSKLSSRELRQVMAKTQNIYDKGYASMRNKNSRVDYNAYAKKFLGDFIDRGLIKIKS